METRPLRAVCAALLAAMLLALPAVGLAERSGTEKAGDALSVLVPAAAFALTLYEDDREGSLEIGKSLAVGTLATFAFKEATDKKRPDGECCDSFPSAHASAAFGGAAFIHKRYGWRRALPVYLVATFVGYSRVDADKHFTEDVLAGAAVGILSSWLLTTRFQDTEIVPVVARGRYGLLISRRW